MNGKPWSPDRKLAQAKRMKARWSNPSYRSAQVGRLRLLNNGPEARQQAAQRMKQLNERMRSDKALKKKNVAGQKRARRDPAYRAIQSLVMAETMAQPEMRELAREHCRQINRDPKVGKRQTRGKRRKQELAEATRIPGDVDQTFLLLMARETGMGRARS
jgi:hypothetical protein